MDKGVCVVKELLSEFSSASTSVENSDSLIDEIHAERFQMEVERALE